MLENTTTPKWYESAQSLGWFLASVLTGAAAFYRGRKVAPAALQKQLTQRDSQLETIKDRVSDWEGKLMGALAVIHTLETQQDILTERVGDTELKLEELARRIKPIAQGVNDLNRWLESIGKTPKQ